MDTAQKLKIEKSDAEWREILTPEQYRITRQHGTERAFSSPDFDLKKKGSYHCICCDRLLYRSDAKFNSGTGWPSFFQPASRDAVTAHRDLSYGMDRVKSAAPIAMRISATSSRMVRSRPACVLHEWRGAALRAGRRDGGVRHLIL